MQSKIAESPTPQAQDNGTVLNYFFNKIGKDNTACLMILFGTLTWTIGFIYCNQNNMSSIQTNLVRGVSVALLNFIIARMFGYSLEFKQQITNKNLLIRNSIISFQGFITAFVQFYLPLPVVQTISNTGPLFVFILDYFINQIKINVKQVIGIGIGIIGIILTVNGKLIMSFFTDSYDKTDFTNYVTNDPLILTLVSLLFVFAMFLWAYAIILTKKIPQNSIQINLHLSICLILIFGFLYPVAVTRPVETKVYLMSYIYSGFIIALGQIFYIGGLNISKNTGAITIVGFISVVVGYLFSIFRYHEPVNPINCIGAILIIFGVLRVVLSKQPQTVSIQNPQQKR